MWYHTIDPFLVRIWGSFGIRWYSLAYVLGFIAIFPTLVTMNINVSYNFASFYGGTGLLIVVGVALDTLQQVEAHLLMRHYEGLMKSGHIRGRSRRM